MARLFQIGVVGLIMVPLSAFKSGWLSHSSLGVDRALAQPRYLRKIYSVAHSNLSAQLTSALFQTFSDHEILDFTS